jgi:hypothetical protein
MVTMTSRGAANRDESLERIFVDGPVCIRFMDSPLVTLSLCFQGRLEYFSFVTIFCFEHFNVNGIEGNWKLCVAKEDMRIEKEYTPKKKVGGIIICIRELNRFLQFYQDVQTASQGKTRERKAT